MRNAKTWLIAVAFAAGMAGGALVLGTKPIAQAAEEKGGDHWQNHDGHWSYWHEGDKRWYYTDGTHWYFNEDGAWRLYGFDRKFGKEGFVHGGYKVPGPEVKVVVPRHEIFRKK
jgi:hypothetical protein